VGCTATAGLPRQGKKIFMEALSPKLVCPSCKGTRLVAGTFWEKSYRNFAPKGKMMLLGYSPLSFVCRDCGYLGICLSEKERGELDAKVQEG
jgi:hypothetical protein